MIDDISIGLGGNVGTRDEIVARFVRARDVLRGLGEVRSAPLYRTAPIGPAQPAFLNTALLVRADVTPDALLATTRALEAELGRDRAHEVRWGPRTLDLDVLAWGARVIRTPALEVPHPRLAQRRFALAPLADLLGADAFIPGVGELRAALARVADQVLEPLGAW